MQVLIVDDVASLRRTLRLTLESQGHRVTEAGTGTAALSMLGSERIDLVFLDLRLGQESGLELLPTMRMRSPGVGIVVMTAFAAVDTAVEAMRRGAFDYLPKPFTPEQLRLLLARWEQVRGLQREVDSLREQMRAAVPELDLSTDEPQVQSTLDVAFRVAPTDAAVLIRGESGTGKGVLARAIHQRSKRVGRPMIPVNCPSLSAELLESELFGHARGAFTGAVEATEGKVAAADGGTLFLDEIGDLPVSLQPKLLRFLQEKQYERVGEARTRTADVRILAATNRDLEADVAAGRFREDLLYRLNVIELSLPPLRERRRDLLAIARHLLQFFARQTGKELHGFTPEAEAAIYRHRWPGNLRELRNAIERGVILTMDSEVDLRHLPHQLAQLPSAGRIEVGGPVTLEALEAEHIRRVIATSASLEDAATILGIDPSTLYRKRKKLG
ncbi:sigma-54-dependent transcriptional regulator [Tuwongella immobilis]|uniref:sigma-54-dependent transcriptional regulator n=1 Tax=Tuwongella immobilis TaxID=692036 RepID=UPI0013A6DD21